MGLNSIFRWQVERGSDIYLIFNYDWDQIDGDLRPAYIEGAIKVAWTFRF